MATGFGIDPTLNSSGIPTSGTTSKDIRNITAGIYTPGVISGAKVSTSASAMTYSVSAGVIAVPITSTEVVLAPVPATTIPTAIAPTSGTRTDVIYADQGIPSIDGHSNIQIKVGTSLPARSVELGRRSVGANIKNTNAAIKTGNIDYSVPYGASMGIIFEFRDTRNGIINHARSVVHTRTINLPTDRTVRLSMTSAMNSRNASAWEVAKYCTVAYEVKIDGATVSKFNTGGLERAIQTFTFQDTYVLRAGTHTVRFDMFRGSGAGYPVAHYGGGLPGTVYTLEDIGPVK